MNRTRLFISALILLALFGGFGLLAEGDKAFVKMVTGNAEIKSPGGDWRKLNAQSIIQDSDEIRTADKSSVIVIYKSTEIRLAEKTSAKIASMLDKTKPIQIDLKKGFGWFHVNDAKVRGFKVVTPTSVAAVRGTKFAVGQDDEGSVSCVCEGKVDTSQVGSEDEITTVEQGKSVAHKNGMKEDHDFSKYFRGLFVDRSFQSEIVKDAKLNNCKNCHEMTNLKTEKRKSKKRY